MLKNKITTFEAISIILTFSISYTLISILKNIIEKTSSSSGINLLYVGIISIVLTIFIIKLFKKFQSNDILDISEYIGGNNFKKIIGFIFIAYFIFTASILLRNFAECLKIVYYPLTDIGFLILTFIVCTSISCKLNFSTIGKVNSFIIPIFLLSIVFLFLANIPYYSFSQLFPIMGDGIYETFILGLGNLSAFSGIVFIYFLPPLLKTPDKFKKVSISSIVLIAIYFILTAIMVLFLFSSTIEVDQISILYSITRNIEFSTFFQRLDSAFLLIWILQVISFIALSIKLSLIIFKKVTNIENEKMLVYTFNIITFSIAFLPKDYGNSSLLENIIYNYLTVPICIILGFILLILANLKLKKKERFINEKNS